MWAALEEAAAALFGGEHPCNGDASGALVSGGGGAALGPAGAEGSAAGAPALGPLGPAPLVLVVLNKADLLPMQRAAQLASGGRALLERAAEEPARFPAAGGAAAPSALEGRLPLDPRGVRVLEPVSCLTGAGLPGLIAALEDGIQAVLFNGEPGSGGGGGSGVPLLTRLRHRQLVDEAAAHLRRAAELGGGSGPEEPGGRHEGGAGERAASGALELAAEEVRLAEAVLAQLTGAAGGRDVERMLDALFSEFCIGK
jgi:tRNA U34 5-carboxymethylaminomethyl modifying GTPase MnmE/TrmE